MRAFVLGLVALGAAAPVAAADMDRGRQLYDQWCLGCHERLGPMSQTMPGTTALAERYQGARPPALVDRDDMTRDFVKTIVRQGVSFMPHFRKTELTDAELDDLSAWLTTKPPAR